VHSTPYSIPFGKDEKNFWNLKQKQDKFHLKEKKEHARQILTD
jgi:hypothetical protein